LHEPVAGVVFGKGQEGRIFYEVGIATALAAFEKAQGSSNPQAKDELCAIFLEIVQGKNHWHIPVAYYRKSKCSKWPRIHHWLDS